MHLVPLAVVPGLRLANASVAALVAAPRVASPGLAAWSRRSDGPRGCCAACCRRMLPGSGLASRRGPAACGAHGCRGSGATLLQASAFGSVIASAVRACSGLVCRHRLSRRRRRRRQSLLPPPSSPLPLLPRPLPLPSSSAAVAVAGVSVISVWPPASSLLSLLLPPRTPTVKLQREIVVVVAAVAAIVVVTLWIQKPSGGSEQSNPGVF